jgi:hypothetical protein
VDGDGEAAQAPGTRSGRLLLPVRAADGVAVALVHADGAVGRDVAESAIAACRQAIENSRPHAIPRPGTGKGTAGNQPN